MLKVKISKSSQFMVQKVADHPIEAFNGDVSVVTEIFSLTNSGTEVKISEKDLSYIKRATTQFFRSQEILQKLFEGKK